MAKYPDKCRNSVALANTGPGAWHTVLLCKAAMFKQHRGYVPTITPLASRV